MSPKKTVTPSQLVVVAIKIITEDNGSSFTQVCLVHLVLFVTAVVGSCRTQFPTDLLNDHDQMMDLVYEFPIPVISNLIPIPV